jgi:Na+-translocating ferredoxin:NAD+ oxidoreductase RNF subunit RnfB
MNSRLTRRDLFSLLTGQARQASATPALSDVERVAIIQGRRCLALTSFCSVCVERCPVPGALKTTDGLPSVVPDVCTGCGICQQVCPAPENAVLMLPRRQKLKTLQPA